MNQTKPNETKTSNPDHCRITVMNDVLGTVEVFESPQSVEEALDNHGACLAANNWQVHHFDEEDTPVEVVIRHDDNQIIIHWYPTGDNPEQERLAIRDALDAWRAER